MKTYSSELIAALEGPGVTTAGAVNIATSAGFRVWGGEGTFSINGEDYVGIGDRGLVSETSSQLGGAEQALELVLSGVDSDVIPIIHAANIRNAAALVWRLVFDINGVNCLGAFPRRGRIDSLSIEDVPGGKAKITARSESAAKNMGRQTGRQRSDADQRALDPTDGGMKWATQAPLRSLAWGGKPPARVSSGILPGSVTRGGGGVPSSVYDYTS